MAIELRTWYDAPGDSLLLPVHLFDQSLDLVRFTADSGISPENLVVSHLVTFPIPEQSGAEGPRGIAGLKAEFLSHPLAWLPRRLAGSYILERDEHRNPTRVEGKHHHAVRVAIEMLTSGLYDEVEGKWVDCFALMGLDTQDPGTIERARAWLSGGQDIAFDTFALSDYLSHDEMAANAHATDMMEFLFTEAYALQAHSLSQLLTDLTTGQVGQIPPRTFGRNITSWAMECLPGEPVPDMAEWTPWDEFDDQLEALTDAPEDEDAVLAVLERMGTQMWAVREYYWELREENHAAVLAEAEAEGVTAAMISGEDPDSEWGRPEPQMLAILATEDQQDEPDPFAEEEPIPNSTEPQMLAIVAAPQRQDDTDPFALDEPESPSDPDASQDPFAEEEPPPVAPARTDNFTW